MDATLTRTRVLSFKLERARGPSEVWSCRQSVSSTTTYGEGVDVRHGSYGSFEEARNFEKECAIEKSEASEWVDRCMADSLSVAYRRAVMASSWSARQLNAGANVLLPHDIASMHTFVQKHLRVHLLPRRCSPHDVDIYVASCTTSNIIVSSSSSHLTRGHRRSSISKIHPANLKPPPFHPATSMTIATLVSIAIHPSTKATW